MNTWATIVYVVAVLAYSCNGEPSVQTSGIAEGGIGYTMAVSGGGGGWISGAANNQGGWYPGASGRYADYVSRYTGPIAVPVVLADGTIADTAEVAEARAAHLAALDKAKALWFGKYDDGSYNAYKYGDNLYGVTGSHGSLQHTGAAINAVQVNALAETRAALWQAKSARAYAGAGSYDTSTLYNKPYSGPLANPAVLSTGYLEDTPEVAAARGSHLAALWEAKQAAALWKPQRPQHWA